MMRVRWDDPAPCDVHEPGDPLCHYPDTFHGRIELRDGPDFGKIYELPRGDTFVLVTDLIGAVLVIGLPLLWLLLAAKGN